MLEVLVLGVISPTELPGLEVLFHCSGILWNCLLELVSREKKWYFSGLNLCLWLVVKGVRRLPKISEQFSDVGLNPLRVCLVSRVQHLTDCLVSLQGIVIYSYPKSRINVENGAR
jgi:hypothetical protein